MAQNALGTKHVCPECSTRFYDLGGRVNVCPKCACALSIEGNCVAAAPEENVIDNDNDKVTFLIVPEKNTVSNAHNGHDVSVAEDAPAAAFDTSDIDHLEEVEHIHADEDIPSLEDEDDGMEDIERLPAVHAFEDAAHQVNDDGDDETILEELHAERLAIVDGLDDEDGGNEESDLHIPPKTTVHDAPVVENA